MPLAFADEHVLEPHPVFYPGQGLIGEAFKREEPISADDYAHELAHPPPWASVRSGIAVPLRGVSKVLGALSAQHYSEPTSRPTRSTCSS